jgi:hypothetical protein
MAEAWAHPTSIGEKFQHSCVHFLLHVGFFPTNDASMSNAPFSPSMLETARAHIAGLFSAYQAATGYKPTFVSAMITGDRAFSSRFLKTGLNVSTYDQFVGRMSGLWPPDKPWPEAIPRQPPLPLDEAGAAMLSERQAACPVSQPAPQIADWPEDIPRPDARI